MFRNPKNLGRRHAVQRRRPLSLESLEPRCLLSSYSVVDLGFLPGAFRTSFQDINNAGQIVGSCGEHAVLWTPTTARDGTGAMTDLGIPEGYDVSIAKAISSDARIAGVAGTYDAAAYQPCVWSPGSTTAQVIDSTTNGDVRGVNNQGKVVGFVIAGGEEHACVWESDGSDGYVATDLDSIFPPAEIPELPGNGTFWLREATAINDNNQIVANGVYLEDADGDKYAEVVQYWGFLLEDPDNDGFHTGAIAVANLGALGSRQYTFANDINNLGQIVGASVGARNNQGLHAVLWQDGVMQDLGTLPKEVSSRAFGISDTGLVVGYSQLGGGSYPHPFLWQDGRMTALNTMIPADSGWTLRYANAVNDRGEIVGTGEVPLDVEHYAWRGYLLSTSVTCPTISIGDASVTEGDDGTTAVQLGITISEPAGAGQSISVDYYTTGCYNDSASPDLDFITAAGTVTFGEGQASQVVTVQVKGDMLAGVNADTSGNTDQGSEIFYVNLANPRNDAGGQTAVFLDAQGKVTIVEDEPAMSISDVRYLEGNSDYTPFDFTVALSTPAKQEVKVYWYTKDSTAIAGVDYIADADWLTIPAGESSGTITVQVIGDTKPEDTYPFAVFLDKATVQNAYIPDFSNRTGGWAFGFIENDDRAKSGKPRNASTKLTAADKEAIEMLAESQYQPIGNVPKGGGWLYAAALDAFWADDDDAEEEGGDEDQLLQMLAFDQLR